MTHDQQQLSDDILTLARDYAQTYNSPDGITNSDLQAIAEAIAMKWSK